MSEPYQPPRFTPPSSSVLKDKVVVLTGGAAGIGSATVRLLHQAGAHVFFGDVLDDEGSKLENELAEPEAVVRYVRCDVTSYEDNLRLFDAAFNAFGRIDHAWSNAGIVEQGDIFDPSLTLNDVKAEPNRSLKVLDVNLKGPIYFARIASVYLRQGDQSGDRSLLFTSSVGGFREDPGLWVYAPTKHGVLGLMRVVRERFARPPFSLRTNAICPWATVTKVFEGVKDIWEKSGLPSNQPGDVAKIVVGVLSDPQQKGGALYVEGGRAWDVEAGLLHTRPQWLGERQTKDLDAGTLVLGSGEDWVKNQ
ncbi:Short-chain dehydrogenase/reductase ascJ [Pseudocercospora fuligena]|uniref:Short-chain dehydrogenase/reductase ascJ n=1 Tax=Pseudocercospora fuligena TaxID=685502 RepID=A0A8H6RN21_9PEZI|nr:Short-chain dehydrogenase/reductase ascJ [Pseudocercospora fuligena]